jgi:hypothetical protein
VTGRDLGDIGDVIVHCQLDLFIKGQATGDSEKKKEEAGEALTHQTFQ